MYTKEDIKRVIMRRDGISGEDVMDAIEATQTELDEARELNMDWEDYVDVIKMNLGLDPDYLVAFDKKED